MVLPTSMHGTGGDRHRGEAHDTSQVFTRDVSEEEARNPGEGFCRSLLPALAWAACTTSGIPLTTQAMERSLAPTPPRVPAAGPSASCSQETALSPDAPLPDVSGIASPGSLITGRGQDSSRPTASRHYQLAVFIYLSVASSPRREDGSVTASSRPAQRGLGQSFYGLNGQVVS